MTVEHPYATIDDRGLDALIAERVFGLVRCQAHQVHGDGRFPADNCHAELGDPEAGVMDPEWSSEAGPSTELLIELTRRGLVFDITYSSESGAGVLCRGYRAFAFVQRQSLSRALAEAALEVMDQVRTVMPR